MAERKIRTRFAPSPTGALHMGGVRTALFNYLFAKQKGGDFLLRIEDTDQARFVPGAEDYIVESLKWCGIIVDEGVGADGDLGPYHQSKRTMYRKYADLLIDQGDAYYAFDTPEELSALRSQYEAEKKTFIYSSQTRTSLKNSLTLSSDEVKAKIDAGEPYVIRFKMPENELVEMDDLIRKHVKFNTNELDDKVIFKADGLPTYHLANVVDDYLMQISHVIRGEEWLPSLPLHVLLYRKLGWGEQMPEFAHLPLILKPVGKGKLSKRDGEKLGFPVFPLEWKNADGTVSAGYKEEGYLPEAFVNMLALLGWNPGTEQEIFSMAELIDAFSLERVNKSGAKFDPDKAKWFNHEYLKMKTDSEVAELFKPTLAEKGIAVDGGTLETICGLIKERAHLVSDLWSQSSYFFEAPTEYDAKLKKKRWKGAVPQAISAIKDKIQAVEVFNADDVSAMVKEYIQTNELNMGAVMQSLRLSIVGSGMGADLFVIMEIIGKDETVARLAKACEVLGLE